MKTVTVDAHRSTCELTAKFYVIASIAAFFVFLALPALHFHDPGSHFRTPAIHRSIERHTSLEKTDSETAPQIAAVQLRRFVPLLVVESEPVTSTPVLEVALERPLFPHRLKLSPPRDSSDPLL